MRLTSGSKSARQCTVATALVWVWLVGCGHVGGGESAGVDELSTPFADPQWMLTDISAQLHRPWGDEGVRAVVLVFISADCPVANYYHPTLRKLQGEFADSDVRWFFVHADPRLPAARAEQHAEDYSLQAPVLLDPQHVLARAAGATKTPQAAVITRDGAVAYLGRIDDTYVGYGKKRLRPSKLELRDALTAVTTGQPVAVPRAESVGCFIPFARETAD